MSADAGQQEPGSGTEKGFLREHPRDALISLVILCVLLTIPIWLLVDNYRDGLGVEQLSHAAMLGAPRGDRFGTPVVVYSPAGTTQPDFCVTFEFISLDESSSQAIFGILIDATPSGWQFLSQLRSLPHPPTTLTLLMSGASGLVGTTTSFPLPSPGTRPPSAAPVNCNPRSVNIATLDDSALLRTTQNIATLGSPRSFPDDWYELDDTVNISIPGAKFISSSLILTSRDQDYSLSASVDPPGKNSAQQILEFTIRRPWLLVTYTYLVAAMPFFLLIAIFYTMHRRRRHKTSELPSHAEVAFGVTATLLAILPLHSVLVPSSLPSPTRLDLYFGLGAVGLVGLSIIWVRLLARPEHEPEKSPPTGSPPPSPPAAATQPVAPSQPAAATEPVAAISTLDGG